MDSGGERTVRTRIATVVAVALVLAIGCEGASGEDDPNEQMEGDETPTLQQTEQQEHEEYHSPYFLEGQGELQFDTITFTDVGLMAPEGGGPADQELLEAVARSLAEELTARDRLDYLATVDYDEQLRDPANHLYCDRRHLYVALWRGWDPDRWGYSLWSGCHEQQKFAWNEIDDEVDREEDVRTRVDPLSEAIADSVEEAYQDDCFTTTC